jgi:hypothetical protein
VSNITTLKILVKSEICRAREVDWNHKKQEIYPDFCAYTPHLQRISAATRAGRVIVEMKEKTFRNILDIAKSWSYTYVLNNRSSTVAALKERRQNWIELASLFKIKFYNLSDVECNK